MSVHVNPLLRSWKTLLALVLVLGLLVTVGIAGFTGRNQDLGSQQADAAANTARSKEPGSCKGITINREDVNGDIFNDPYSRSALEREKILRYQTCLIDSTPRGQSYAISTFSFSYGDIERAIEAADRRGVYGQLVMWNRKPQVNYKAFKKLQAFARHAKHFRLTVCTDACGIKGRDKYSHHAKALVTTKAVLRGQTYNNVSVITSENLSGGSADTSYNTAAVLVNRTRIAKGLFSYIKLLSTQKTIRDIKPVTDGPHTLYLYPSKQDNVMYRHIKAVRCVKGKPCIRVMMFSISINKRSYTTELAKRQKGQKPGAVKVITNTGNARYVLKTLQKGHVDARNADIGKMYVHSKAMAVCGNFPYRSHGRTRYHYRCYTTRGDTNWTSSAMNGDDDLQLTTDSSATAKRYFSEFDRIRTRPIAKVK